MPAIARSRSSRQKTGGSAMPARCCAFAASAIGAIADRPGGIGVDLHNGACGRWVAGLDFDSCRRRLLPAMVASSRADQAAASGRPLPELTQNGEWGRVGGTPPRPIAILNRGRRRPASRWPYSARPDGGIAMGTYLSKRELAQTEPAETAAFRSPVPTQMVSNGEFNPLPQTERQRQVEERIKDLADAAGRRLGMDRRRLLRTSCGMAAAFVALNEVFGPLFDVSAAEAAEPEAAASRA